LDLKLLRGIGILLMWFGCFYLCVYTGGVVDKYIILIKKIGAYIQLMNIYFRPLLWPSIFSVIIFAILFSFGTWQVKRLFWKEALIERYTTQSQSNPIKNPSKLDSSINEFKSVEFTGSFLHKNEIYITGKTYEGNAGFHVITPFELNNNKIILINRGWVSEGYRNPEKRKFSLVEGQILIKGIIRYPQKKGYFVPENDGKNGFWFTIKPNEIINFLNLTSNKVINNYYIDALRQGEKLTLPIGVTGKPKLRNQHLSYAVTWYGLALSLLFVYFSYHMSSGRLSFKKNDNNE
jgi:surfeit locus 1 family protein